jgi:chaperone modulatory protein CbpM
MRIELTEMVWLEEHRLSLTELATLSGLTQSELQELLGCGAIVPLPGGEHRFGATALQSARTARRLRDDFELDAAALTVVMRLMERVENLERQLREFHVLLPRPSR